MIGFIGLRTRITGNQFKMASAKWHPVMTNFSMDPSAVILHNRNIDL